MKYYTSTSLSAGFAGATRIAARSGTNGTLSYLLSDHLGSSSVTTDANGVKTASALYKAFGETRYTFGNLGTDYKFTGQRLQAELGIYWFQSRWMDPSLGRFTQPDTIVPTQGTQAWDRYAFVNNNPVRYTDPTGHMCEDPEAGDECDGADNHEQALEKPPVGPELSLDEAARVLMELAGGDILLYRAWLSLYKSNEGRQLAQNILNENIKMTWSPWVGSNAECNEGIGCVINIDPKYQNNPEGFNNLVATLGHEAYHHQYGNAWDQSTNSQLEEFRAFQAEDRIYQELTGTPRYIFEGFNTSPESMVDWFKNNDYGLPQYLNLQPYPPTNFYLP